MAKFGSVKLIFSFIILCNLNYVNAINEDLNDAEDYCERTDDGVRCVKAKDLRLTRLNGPEVGDLADVVVDGGQVLKLKTVSVKPLIIEIEDFLRDEECEHFINVAKETGLKSSSTEKHSAVKGINLMDTNADKVLNLDEMHLTIANNFDIYLTDGDILDMYTALKLDTNSDTKITPDELQKTNPSDLKNYLNKFVRKNPEKHSRYSKQAWLFPDSSTDSVFAKVQERVSKVVQLPIGLIRLSDFQVVNYGVKGHYNAHIDSSHRDTSIPCCDRGRTHPCRLCRYMTILFYLNDVGSGGETAFPVANNETLDQTLIHTHGVQNLFTKCAEANLRVPAQKRKAIIWYSHFVDEETGWLGNIDNYTLHGGCPVTEGEKWVANFWVKASDNKSSDIKRMNEVNLKLDARQKDEL